MDLFKKEDHQLVSLQKDIENTDNLEANTVAYLSSKIQEIRSALKQKSTAIQMKRKKMQDGTKREGMSKPNSLSLAEQKRKEYFF